MRVFLVEIVVNKNKKRMRMQWRPRFTNIIPYGKIIGIIGKSMEL